mgnify:CR=1 FL=1
MARRTRSLSSLIAEFRAQVTNYELMVCAGSDGAHSVRNSYGPALEALQSPPPARTVKDTAAALLYILDFGNLGPADEAMLRAAISGIAPELAPQPSAPAHADQQQDSLVSR